MTEEGAAGARIAADVIIVGGGPVGMGLAIELGRRGIPCAVVERHRTPQAIPKGQNLTQRSGEHFRVWGVSEEIRAACPIPHDYGIEGLTAYGSLLSGYSYDWLRRGAVRPYYAADNERLPQYETEKVLRRRAAELDAVTILYGWAAEAVAQEADRARVTIAARDGERAELRAPYVVGCDGSRSVVREAVGIEQEVDEHDKRMVLLVFRSRELHQLLERFPGKSYYNVLTPELKGYWRFLGRVDLGESWFFHAPVPPETTAENFDFAALLHETVGRDVAITFDHIGFWDLRIALAATYRKGPVFIAGDAAHSHPPYGAFGVNTGFEDARNLGWKLAAERQSWAGARLLDSYSAERQPVFASTAEDFIDRMIRDDRAFLEAYDPTGDRAAFEAAWERRASGGNAEVTGFEPHYEGSPVVWGPEGGVSGAVGRHSFKARAGHHLSPRPLSSGEDVYDRLGDGFTLLALGAGPEVPRAFAEAAARRGVPLTLVEDDGEGERKDYEAPLVLVRPDHFVAWAGEAPAQEVEAILTRAVGG